ncbi:hypothetical protein DBZ36_12930 [Alginatibacterium sediminis]|uniref:Uncharacterized protein n=2 Tax=Alginatibacterium sediminis TaxID=2164068 RepID=A0A420EBW2_9ALTE|nr:hypothetical protein DBZ36_12930 [Alginatibacterium sediminis]
MWSMMANYYGDSDKFESYGSSAIWERDRNCVSHLVCAQTGLLAININSEESFSLAIDES